MPATFQIGCSLLTKRMSIGPRTACWGWLFTPTTKRTAISSSITPIGKGIRRWRDIGLDAADPNRADAASGQVILSVDQPHQNHNGGMLAFGPDGYLYLGLGDGGIAGDPCEHGQRRDTLLGSILRLDVGVLEVADYSVPPDNPYVGNELAKPEIWAYGLRNPWRFSFDRVTGDLWIGDVGQSHWEEINYRPANSTGGENYGWNAYESYDSI